MHQNNKQDGQNNVRTKLECLTLSNRGNNLPEFELYPELCKVGNCVQLERPLDNTSSASSLLCA